MQDQNQPKVTLVVVPRERYSLTETCIEHIYAHTRESFELIVIDTNSPAWLAERLKKWEKHKPNCRVIRLNRFVYPYEAKNIAVHQLSPQTEWVVFIDSDVKVSPGWLHWFLDAARQTGARVFHPLYLFEQKNQDISIHMADGIIKTSQKNGKTLMQPVMNYVGLNICNASEFVRKESDFIEFHTFMIHRDVLKKIGEFEPITLSEDVHYSFRLREIGEKIVFEPRAVITYVAGPPFEKYDLPYFKFRWNLAKAEESNRLLINRWNVLDAYWKGKLEWMRFHRSRISPLFYVNGIVKQSVKTVRDFGTRVSRKFKHLFIAQNGETH